MEGARTTGVTWALRWLAAPTTLVGLVALVLNDRFLKDAWPGLLTGKLSDVAGLVVAPPLLAVALAWVRVRHVRVWAVGSTGVLFAFAKATLVGSVLASQMWSLALPSLVRQDVTDLVALPALGLAWWAGGRAGRGVPTGRRRSSLVVGALVLPGAVLATTATSCSPADGLREVTLYEGVFTGGDGRIERRIITSDWSAVTVDDTGRLQQLSGLDDERLAEDSDVVTTEACSTSDPRRCWRRAQRTTAAVEGSADGGATWQLEFAVPERELAAVREEVGDRRCGAEPPLGVSDVVVLDGPQGQVVAAASSNTGLLLRSTTGQWRRVPLGSLGRSADPPPTPDPQVQLFPVDPVPTPTTTIPGPTGSTPPRGTSGPAPSPTCASPQTRTYTPDPRNGPPVVVTRCP
ncbi:hypothetical protein ACOCJ5_14080 [Knoellia sp. CPCC 206450]|uniref:hypothetical protein n=1 Tax=Knoellia tibetensis TaxID=3404798 RepID=UPI003B43A882